MSSVPSQPSDRDPLQKMLDDAESELRRRLEEACEAEAGGVSTESTEEVRKLEDNLLAAAFAAKQTIAVRSHMKRRKHAERERPIKVDRAANGDKEAAPSRKGAGESEVDNRGDKGAVGVREFTDNEGRPWRAWLVVPGLTNASSSGRRFLQINQLPPKNTRILVHHARVFERVMRQLANHVGVFAIRQRPLIIRAFDADRQWPHFEIRIIRNHCRLRN